MRKAQDNRRSAVAFWAAVILVVQASLSAWAGAAMAGQPMQDSFGNPLCINNVVSDSDTPIGDHGKLPSCCMLGCAYASPVLLQAGGDWLSALDPRAADAFAPVAWTSPLVADLDHDPGNPRAPPLTL